VAKEAAGQGGGLPEPGPVAEAVEAALHDLFGALCWQAASACSRVHCPAPTTICFPTIPWCFVVKLNLLQH
jgi:hypothetical protein